MSKGKLEPEGAALLKEVAAALQARRHPKVTQPVQTSALQQVAA